MEDLHPLQNDNAATPELPEAGNDPADPLRPEIEEEVENDVADENDGDKEDLSDNMSELSDVDEAQFEDFDPANIAIEDRPAIAVDESNVNQIGKHKRKRMGDDDGAAKKKKREGRREKPKRQRKRRDGDEAFEGGDEAEAKSSRRKARQRTETHDTDDETLTPEERRKRALDRAMDEATRTSRRGRKKDGIDLEAMADQEIEDMRRRMAEAAEKDTYARDRGEPAMYKLKLLPQVVALLNRNTLRQSLVDPDLNLMEAVRFFLEPLNDGSLPAYNIQRELFAALGKLPINKDTLVASGIGKVVLFYTKSNRPEPLIKRQADKLLADWTRPILKRSDDYRKKAVATADYDPLSLPIRNSQPSSQTLAAEAREKALQTPIRFNRARVEAGPTSYTIAPKSKVVVQEAVKSSSGGDFIRKIRARQPGRR